MKYKAFYTIPGKVWEGEFTVDDAYSTADAILQAEKKCRELKATLIGIREITL